VSSEIPHPIPPAVQSPLPTTEGLNRVDQDRAASVADEGGAAAATIESQEGGLAEPASPGKPADGPDDKDPHPDDTPAQSSAILSDL
jgi:hypothetical protein